MGTEKDHNNPYQEKQASRRYRLALFIVGPSLLMLVTISGYMLYGTDIEPETIFTALIGLVGTWVGTILAFYYSKDNFEAASRSTEQLIAKVTNTNDKLKSMLAKDVMLLTNMFTHYVLKKPESEVLLSEVRDAFGEYYRLPILDSEGLPKYIIHKSLLDEFLADFYSGKYDGSAIAKDATSREGDRAKLTLSQFIGIDTIGTKVKKGFITSTMDDNLHALKEKMIAVTATQCSDAYITVDGSAKSKVVGWVTNGMILENSKV